MCHILVVMDDIMGIGWLHRHGRIVGHMLDDVYVPCVSMNDSIRTITSYFHTSMVVHQGSNDYLQIRKWIHGNMLSSSSKKQRNRKVSLNNGILRVVYKMTIKMLMKLLYISVWYFYITNRLISGDISRVIYKPSKSMKSDSFTQAVQGKLININKLELTKVNSIKSIGSKWVKL